MLWPAELLYRQPNGAYIENVCISFFQYLRQNPSPLRHSMLVAIATVNQVGSIKTEVGSTEIACCASAQNGHSGASMILCVTAYFLLDASDFGTIAVTVAPKHMGDLKLLPPKPHNELKSQID